MSIITIPLYRQKKIKEYAIIDYEDFGKINHLKWQIHSSRKHFYAAHIKNKKPIFMHRLLINAKEGEVVDHINGCGLDNRKSNLRIVSHRLNSLYFRHKQNGTSSKYLGVSWHKTYLCWHARIQLHNKQYHLGYFDKELLAARAYQVAKNNYLCLGIFP